MTKKQPQAEPAQENKMPLAKGNYKLMLIGLGVIIAGFLLMLGGRSESAEVFNYDMFSFRRITLAPIVVLAGFAFEVYAIMKRCKRG